MGPLTAQNHRRSDQALKLHRDFMARCKDVAASSDTEQSRMKWYLLSFLLLTLLTAGLGVCQCGWLKKNTPPDSSNVYLSEAALRNKHCMPHHWRSMVLQK